MSDTLHTLSEAFLALLSQTRWKEHDKVIWLSIRKYHDLHKGVTDRQLKLLNKIYSKYGK